MVHRLDTIQCLVSMQKVACEESPEGPSNSIAVLLTYPHLFSSCQVRGHQGGALTPLTLRPSGMHEFQSRSVFDEHELNRSRVVDRGDGQEEDIVPCHWGCELAGGDVVAAASVGDHLVTLGN